MEKLPEYIEGIPTNKKASCNKVVIVIKQSLVQNAFSVAKIHQIFDPATFS
jgi:hypothetical protein